jgi:ABC-type sugar transport system substrate-binding protein
MRKKIMAIAFTTTLLAALATPVFGVPFGGATAQATADKVDICHSTRSETNPFVDITVSVHAAGAHGAHHDGDDQFGECRGE